MADPPQDAADTQERKEEQKGMNRLRRWGARLGRTLAYARRGWQSEDWDYHYLLGDLHFKLTRMLRRFTSPRCPVLWDDELDRLVACLKAIERLQADAYDDHLLDAHEAQWGELVCPVCGERFCDCWPAPEGRGCIWVVLNAKVRTAEDDAQCSADYAALRQQAAEAEAADLALLFDTMRDTIRRWWD